MRRSVYQGCRIDYGWVRQLFNGGEDGILDNHVPSEDDIETIGPPNDAIDHSR
jgi:hypothetical protein